jgi:hypothetical protein
MKKFLFWLILTFAMYIFLPPSASAAYVPDSLRVAWIRTPDVWDNSPPRVFISRYIRSKAQECKYNYAGIDFSPLHVYWGYLTSNGVDPFNTSGANAGTLIPGARQYFKDVVKNAFLQLDSFNLKMIPMFAIGQHAFIGGWPLMSEGMSLNYERYENSVRNITLPGANGYPFFIKDIRTAASSKARFARTGNRAIRDTVKSSGLGRQADSLSYIFEPLDANANCTVATRVVSLSSTNVKAKAGLMIRDSLSAGSRFAMICYTPANRVYFLHRDASGGNTDTVVRVSGISLPIWLRIQRVGNLYTGSYSSDGTSWSTLGSATINFETNRFDDFVGLITTSGNKLQSCTSLFESTYWGNYGIAKPVASTPFAPDPGVGHFDRAFDTLLAVFKEAFNEVQGSLKYHSLDYVHIAHDECITDADTSRAYFLIGECSVDQSWIQSHLSMYGNSLETTVQNLMGSEIKRRVHAITSRFGGSTKVIMFADMWDRNMYDSKNNKVYPAIIPATYSTSSFISTWGVVNTDSAKFVKDTLILQPWRYGDPTSYNTYDTYNSFKLSGFKFQYGWSLVSFNAPADCLLQLSKFIENSWKPEFKSNAIGYYNMDFTCDTLTCAKGMNYNSLWDLQTGKYSAALYQK